MKNVKFDFRRVANCQKLKSIILHCVEVRMVEENNVLTEFRFNLRVMRLTDLLFHHCLQFIYLL